LLFKSKKKKSEKEKLNEIIQSYRKIDLPWNFLQGVWVIFEAIKDEKQVGVALHRLKQQTINGENPEPFDKVIL